MREEQSVEVNERQQENVKSNLSNKTDSATVVNASTPSSSSMLTNTHEKNNIIAHKLRSSKSNICSNDKKTTSIEYANAIETNRSDVENDESNDENDGGILCNHVCATSASSHSSFSSSSSSIVSETDTEGMVTVVQDASTYDAHLTRKNRDAKWVKGLSPEDELKEKIALQQEQIRRARKLAEELQLAARYEWEQSHPFLAWWSFMMARYCTAREGWLRVCNWIGVLYLCVVLAQESHKLPTWFPSQVVELDYPVSEQELWPYTRHLGENPLSFAIRVALPLLLPSVFATCYALLLSFRIGTAAHHFTALCGVGTALLYFVALATQLSLLWNGCSELESSGQARCDVPYVFYWCCTIVRLGCPLLSVWCVSPVLDLLGTSRNWFTSLYWRALLAIPLVTLAIGVFEVYSTQMVSGVLTTAVTYSTIASWSYLLIHCWRLAPFEMHVDFSDVTDELQQVNND